MGSPIVYILYASQSGHCHDEAEHRIVFEAAASAIVPCLSGSAAVASGSAVAAARGRMRMLVGSASSDDECTRSALPTTMPPRMRANLPQLSTVHTIAAPLVVEVLHDGSMMFGFQKLAPLSCLSPGWCSGPLQQRTE